MKKNFSFYKKDRCPHRFQRPTIYKDVEGKLNYECPVCGRYMDKKHLNDHNCPGNREDVEMIERFFGHR